MWSVACTLDNCYIPILQTQALCAQVSLEAFTMLALDVLPDAVRDIETALGRLCAVPLLLAKRG